METLTHHQTKHPLEAAPLKIAPIVVATDGTEQSEGALTMAQMLAHQLRADIRVLAVQPPLALVVPEGQLVLDPKLSERLAADLARRVRDQCAQLATGDNKAPLGDLELMNGEPARTISRVAMEREAQLLVVGIGRHDIRDRFFGSETALKVARHAKVPVLAVPAGPVTVPRHAVVAVDFSEPSVRSAQAALRLLADGGILELVHVIPRERLLVDAWVSADDYRQFVRHSFTRFLARLAVPAGITVTDYTLTGNPARELLTYAERVEADLIAVGSHGHGFVSRLVIGSLTTKLLRGARCAVLVTPPDVFSDPKANATGARTTLHVERAHWREVLDDFTRTNAGRRTQLEVDDPEFGAQAQEHDYPLRGLVYDPKARRVELMLGEVGAGKPHLSRSIVEVDAIDVLTDRDGNDIALRLRHGSGQTILTLVP